MVFLGFLIAAAGVMLLGLWTYKRTTPEQVQKFKLPGDANLYLIIGAIAALAGLFIIFNEYKNNDLGQKDDPPAAVEQTTSQPGNPPALENTPTTGPETEKKDDKKAPDNAIVISSVQLCREYRENEPIANTKYRDQLLKVNGTINFIGRDFMNKLVVILDGHDAVTNTQCFFAPEKVGQLNKLRRGQTVTIKGLCSGRVGDVLIQECDIVIDKQS